MGKTIDLKDNLHSLIDKIEDKELLAIIYQLLNSKGEEKNSNLLEQLTAQQKKELYEAYDESFDDSNLIDLEQLKSKHSRWFEK